MKTVFLSLPTFYSTATETITPSSVEDIAPTYDSGDVLNSIEDIAPSSSDYYNSLSGAEVVLIVQVE